MKMLIAFLSITLAACETSPSRVLTEVKTQDVRVAVVQSCIRVEDIEPIPPSAADPDKDLRARVAGMAIDGQTYRSIAEYQQKLLKACLTKQ